MSRSPSGLRRCVFLPSPLINLAASTHNEFSKLEEFGGTAALRSVFGENSIRRSAPKIYRPTAVKLRLRYPAAAAKYQSPRVRRRFAYAGLLRSPIRTAWKVNRQIGPACSPVRKSASVSAVSSLLTFPALTVTRWYSYFASLSVYCKHEA